MRSSAVPAPIRAASTLALAVACATAASTAGALDTPPRVRVAWTDTPPEIDGKLDDSAWEHAAVIDDFTQVTPVPGSTPSERTEIRILTDEENLYFYVRCWDENPDGIVANRMVRDGILFFDDRVQIVLDTFHDRQNGFLFEVNPVGGRRDVLLEGDAFSISWDTIWYARSRRDDQGWTAELKIPYQSLNYDPNKDEWGLNIERGVRRKGEQIRWADPVPQRFINDLGNAGVLEGMTGVGSGLGLDVVPALALSYENGFVSDPAAPTTARKVDDFEANPSGDVFYKLLPSLTATLTANTNFGETEADTRQVNFSRFAVAFPEKRDFFLQDALIFEFAELTDDNLALPTNGQPFHSRRIGIAQPNPDPTNPEFVAGEILFGGKLTGRVGDVKLGVLHTLVDELESVDRQHLTVGRAAVNVLGESTLGMIVTHGDPDGQIENSVVGADFVYRNSSFRGNQSLTGKAWVQRSFSTHRDGNEFAFAAGISYPNDRVLWRLDYQDIGKDFNPALGFVNRRGIRRYEGEYRYRFRTSGYIRTFDLELLGNLTTGRSNEVESGLIRLTPFQYENLYGGRVDIRVQHNFEKPLGQFDLPGGLTVPTDAYHFSDAQIELRGSRNWTLTGDLTLGGGQYFGGERIYAIPAFEWRPSKHFLVKTRYELRRTWLPGLPGDPEQSGTTHVVRAELATFFTPDISWTTLIQYDNVSRSVGINSRLRWIVEDGREIFVILNQGVEVIDDKWRRGVTQPLVKVAWTFRF